MRTISITCLLLPIAILIAASCKNNGSPDQTGDSMQDNGGITMSADQVRLAGLKFGGVEETEISGEIQAQGVLSIPNDHHSSIGALVNGVVEKIYVHLGDEVDAEQVLCRLKHPSIIELQGRYIEVVYRHRLNLQKYERAKTLVEENISSQKSFEQVEADLMRSRAEKESLELHLHMLGLDPENIQQDNLKEYLDIKSPIKGTVSNINIHLGCFVDKDEVMMEVVDRSKMHIELKIFEKDIPFIEKGQRVMFTLANVGDRTYEARIFAIGGKLETGSRVIRVLAEFDNQDGKLYPGMFCAANIMGTPVRTSALKESAFIRESDDEYYLFVKTSQSDDGSMKFTKINAVTGKRLAGYIELLGPDRLFVTSDIVTEGAYYIKSHMLKELE
jgi:cobalt-zinc-cadmium efflux system membrane fusion protein